MRSKFQKEFRQLFSILPEAGKVIPVFTGWCCMVSSCYVCSFIHCRSAGVQSSCLGDTAVIPLGHNAWVVGNGPVELIQNRLHKITRIIIIIIIIMKTNDGMKSSKLEV